MFKTLLPATAAAVIATTSHADVPQVATDIAPVHGLVARVMQGLGSPDLIVPAGASPHGHSMRPSEARALAAADVLVWMGEGLTPWLEGPVETLAENAEVLELLAAPQGLILPYREAAVFAEEDEAAHDDHGDEDQHDDHGDHDDHDDDDGHDGHDDHDGHAHEGADPHAWLAPENGKAWLDLIAAKLAELDPENAEIYRANALAGQAEIDAAAGEVTAMIAPLKTRPIVVFHDAYQYFEQAFGLEVLGAISLSDAAKPSPAHLAKIRTAAREHNVACIFAEPQFNPDLVASVAEGTEAGTAVLDPLGSDISIGPDFYPALLRSLGAAAASC